LVKVAVKNLFKRFGNVVAVDRVSFYVDSGEFLALLGPSGCGKTTTLRLIAGLERPDGGEIYIGERLVNDLPPRDRDVAMVFQNYALYPHMRVYDNIAFPLKIRGVGRDEIDRRVKEVAKMLGIEDLLDRYPKQLSGGQQQRVALGRALVRRPKVFLMDEPLSNLDAKLRVYMRAELKRLQRELKITTIYVTHDQAEAMTMADRVAVMNKSKILQIAEPSEIYNRPANTFVAEFIGSPPMNLIDASILWEDSEAMLDTGYLRIKLPKDISQILAKLGHKSEVILGIRPEHIVVSKEYIPDSYPVEVYVVEPLGSETIVNIRHGDKIIKARYPGYLSAKPGERIYISFQKERLHIFSKETGLAII
jgi:multiple sugar transport system ATP-binding protein